MPEDINRAAAVLLLLQLVGVMMVVMMIMLIVVIMMGKEGGEGGPVESPLLCNPLTGSQADEHPGHGQHYGSGEEEDAQ